MTGDTHGETDRFVYLEKALRLTKDDTLVIAGDFGCIFSPGDESKLDMLEKMPFTILFVDGNHECFPRLYSFPVEMWNGGRVHRVRKNVRHLMRGQVYDIDGTTVFTMGGGRSVDYIYRIPGRSWWPEELPDEAEYDEARENLKKHGDRVDVIVSHTAPDDTMQMFLETSRIPGRAREELRLNFFLEDVRRTVAHSHYYFGHLHMDCELWRGQIALYYNVYDMKTGVKCLEYPGS